MPSQFGSAKSCNPHLSSHGSASASAPVAVSIQVGKFAGSATSQPPQAMNSNWNGNKLQS